jgi:NAD+ kinase
MKTLYIPTFNKTTEIDSYFFRHKAKEIEEKKPEYIIVSGGDGSLLHAIQDYQYMKVPFIGIAAGTLNFLMNEVSLKEIKNLKKEDITIIKAYTLKIKVKRERSNGSEKTVFKAIAMNDIVFGGRIMDYNSFDIRGFKQKEISIKGMGLIFSTAIGSTAFYYNNGGVPIKDIGKGIIGIASIVSERNKAFNEHMTLDKTISVEIRSERNTCSLYIDGETQVFELKKGDTILI